MSGWLARVPVGVWLFLAATQALNVAVAPRKLADLREGLQQLAELEERSRAQPDFADHLARHREVLKSMRRDQWFNMIAATILLPCFLMAALWRWKAQVGGRNDGQG